MKKVLVSLVIFLMISVFNVQAYTINPIADTKENSRVEELYDYMSNMKTEYEILNDVNIKDYVKSYMQQGNGKFSTKKVSKALITYSFKEVIACIKLMSTVVVICIVCALISNLESAFSNGKLSNIAYFACYALLIVLMSKSFYLGITVAKDAIKNMTDFMAALIPVLLMLLATVGGFTEAAIMDPIVIGVINISARIFVDLIIPLICMSFVVQFVNNISEEHQIDRLCQFLNKSALWIQGILMTIFIGVITIRGISSSTIDAVAEKTMKFAIDSFIPIVGKSLSDAISTVAGYSLLLKNALSSIGLVILIVIVLFPLIKIVIMALIYKITAILIEPVSDKRLVKSITAAGDSLILITSCLICVSVMFFIMIAIIASAGKMVIAG